MAYVKRDWQNGVTRANADNMDHLETQYDEAMAEGAATFISAPLTAAASLVSLPDMLDNTWRYQQSSYSQDNIVTLDDGTVYAVWLRTGDIHPIVGKLVPGAATWETFDLRTIAGDPFGTQTADGHNTFTLGIAADGRIHVSGNMHGVALKYALSTNPGDITAWVTPGMIGTEETSVSYPIFVNNSNGILYFIYRSGTSGQGNIIMNRWTGTAWIRVATVLDGDSSLEGPYVNHVAPDREGGLHFMFMWRETADADSNTDIGYLRYTGSTWLKSDGSTQTMPATHANCETVIPMAQETGLINQTGLDVDIDGNPHGVFMWYDAGGETQYYHVWHDGTDWETEQVSSFVDRVETIDVTGTLNLIVARPQILCTSNGKTYVIGRARSTENNRPILIDVSTEGNPVSVLFDMDLSTWEPAFDQRKFRRDDDLRMLVTDLESPATAGHGYNRQWGGILTIDLYTAPLVSGGAPRFGTQDADRATDILVRGSLVVNTDLNTLLGMEHVGNWLMGSGVTLVNQPNYGVTRPAQLIVTKPHRVVTHQTVIGADARIYTRTCNAGTWSLWSISTGGSLAAVPDGTTLISLWHGDYKLSAGSTIDYPGEPTDFAALNADGYLEVRVISSSGTTGAKFYRLTLYDRTMVWETTTSGSTFQPWLKVRG